MIGVWLELYFLSQEENNFNVIDTDRRYNQTCHLLPLDFFKTSWKLKLSQLIVNWLLVFFCFNINYKCWVFQSNYILMQFLAKHGKCLFYSFVAEGMLLSVLFVRSNSLNSLINHWNFRVSEKKLDLAYLFST